jgi:hypothetical protein
MKRLSQFVLLAVLLNFYVSIHAQEVAIIYDESDPQISFAVDEIVAVAFSRDGIALDKRSLDGSAEQVFNTNDLDAAVFIGTQKDTVLVDLVAVLGADVADLEPEGFSIRFHEQGDTEKIFIIGADSAGAMYGGLEVAEVLRTKAGSEEEYAAYDRNPYMKRRGTKFNIPLDVRTPTYTDPCDSAQKNIPEMWNYDFWTEYIDCLARHRYNFVSLWNLHPFPSMVRVPDYPDVALDDVRRSTVEWEELYSLNGIGFDAPEIVDNYETLYEMTIDEKMDFWRKVMAYGKSRNVDFYVVTWNIFVNGTDGKYGITDDIDNPTTRDYFRKSIAQMFETYPDLAGVGLTTGENMHGSNTEAKEDWAFATYGQGVLDAATAEPDRQITLIHRQHQTGALDIADRFQPLVDQPNVNFIFSFKYAKAHVYSSIDQVWHPGFVEDITSRGDLKTIWTLRNDDVFYFRWGAPDFVREFILNIPYDVSDGYYFGSDQYVWGREFLSNDPSLPETGAPRQIELAKHWYHWSLWGRLGYDPTLTNDRFVVILGARYPSVHAQHFFTAWQSASKVYPLTTGFHWGSLDFQWYIEGCISKPSYAETESGFHDVNRFISLPPHPGTDYISIPDYVEGVREGRERYGTTPFQVAERIRQNAMIGYSSLARFEVEADQTDTELLATLKDIRAMSELGLYYSHKIEGATELALFRAGQGDEHQEKAIEDLTRAALCWRDYMEAAKTQYKNPMWMNRVGHCDWDEMYQEVLHDIEIAGGEIPENLKADLEE